MVRIAVLVLSGNALASALALARNLIIARLIPVADYGVAAMFAVSMAMVEMFSGFGLPQQVVQAKDGDDPRVVAGIQGFQLARGIIAGLALFLLAEPIARMIQAPEATWAFQTIALIPVIRAFVHFDINRISRQMRFGPMVVVDVLPTLVSVLSIWPLSQWFRDYQLMLWALMIHAVLAAILSHLVSERRFRVSYDSAVLLRSLRFGWPLLVSNILLFCVFQGDRIIVGQQYGTVDLAIFSMGVTLILTPTLVLERSLLNIFLPLLSRMQDDRLRFERIAAVNIQATLALSLVFATAVILAGQPVVHLLLGDKYEALLPLISWFGIQQALRLMKGGFSSVALALGNSSNTMLTNIPRVLSLPVAWLVASQGGTLLDLIWVGIVAELAGACVALLLLRYWSGVHLRGMVWTMAAALGCLTAAAVVANLQSAPQDTLLLSVALFALVLSLPGWAMPELRGYLWRMLMRRA